MVYKPARLATQIDCLAAIFESRERTTTGHSEGLILASEEGGHVPLSCSMKS